MRYHRNNWEVGSEFHLIIDDSFYTVTEEKFWQPSIVFTGSGRDAIRLILRMGRNVFKWKRAFVPSYLCPEVIRTIKEEIPELKIYYDDPEEAVNPPTPNSNEVLFLVNTFGIRPRWHIGHDFAGQIIEDHTHDPWSEHAKESSADYCFASLRKTLPVADGAIIWSPKGLSLPKQPKLSTTHHLAASLKLNAMIIKSLYLNGYAGQKDEYLNDFREGEAHITSRRVSNLIPASEYIIKSFDVEKWRSLRLSNYLFLLKELGNYDGINVLKPSSKAACPFSFIVVFDSNNTREKMRMELIRSNIFPAVLWDLDIQIQKLYKSNQNLSSRMLSIHCDGRYSTDDQLQVAEIIKRLLKKV